MNNSVTLANTVLADTSLGQTIQAIGLNCTVERDTVYVSRTDDMHPFHMVSALDGFNVQVKRLQLGCSGHLTGDAEKDTNLVSMPSTRNLFLMIDSNNTESTLDTILNVINPNGSDRRVSPATGFFKGSRNDSYMVRLSACTDHRAAAERDVLVKRLHRALRESVEAYHCMAICHD